MKTIGGHEVYYTAMESVRCVVHAMHQVHDFLLNTLSTFVPKVKISFPTQRRNIRYLLLVVTHTHLITLNTIQQKHYHLAN